MIKTKLGTRMFSVLMVLTMLLSLLPMTAFAKNSKSSAVTLAEGTYTVTANLYVKAEDNKVLGINAYLTNTELPPINPVSENATLIVAANGEMTLKLNELNSIFTLQEIDGSNDAEIVNRTVTEDVQWPEGFEGEKKINSRISALEIKLKQGVDHYVFSNCKEYPTLLASSAELEGYWDVPLTLDIDFDSAYIPFDDKADGIQTYSINDNGVTVDVETSDEQMKSSMSNARLSASYTTENDAITSLLKEKYDSEPSYTAYTLSMNSKLVGNTRATITLPTSLTTAMHVYKLNDNDTLSEVGYYQWNSNTLNASANTKNITFNENDKTISFTASQLGTYIILDISNNYEYQKVEYPDAGNGVSYKMTDSTRWTKSPNNYPQSKYIDYQEVKPLSPKIETVDNIGTAYSVGFSVKSIAGYYMQTVYSSKSDTDSTIPCYKLELTVPGDKNTKAYFITEDGQMFSPASLGAEQLPCTVSDDGKSVVITICEVNNTATSFTAINRIKLMEQRIKTDCVASSGGLSDMTGYVLVTDKDIAGMPISNTNSNTYEYKDKYLIGNPLVYNGSVQNTSYAIRNTDSNVTFSGLDNLKDAGNYPVTANLPEGKYWADGTQGDKTTNLIIRPKKLKAQYKSEVIHVGEEPALKMTSKSSQGWKSADSALKNDPDYQPTLTAPSELKVGYYTLTPELPKLQSDNYYWDLISGTLTVLPQGANDTDQLAEIPTAITGLTYNGSEQTGVADPDENAGYTITGNKGTDAKTYTAVASLKDGYWWMDGTREDKTITWTIEANKEPDSPVIKVYENITANLSVPGELNTQLPGVTAYMTNPDNPLGIVPDGYESVNAVAPTTPVKNNATLTEYADGTYTLTLNVPNPVFTLQKIGDCSNAEIISATRDDKIYSGNTGVSRNGRITKLTIKLKDKSGTYVFNDCTEFPTLLETDWNVPLTLKVDFPSDDDNKADTSNVTIISDIEKTTDNTPTISIKGISSEAKDYFKSLLTKEDVEKIASADNKLTLKVSAGNITDTVSSDDKNMVTDALSKNSLNNYVIGQYLDINAALSTVNKNISFIENGGTVTLSVKLDNSLINKEADRTYKIVRLHKNNDGTKTASVLDTTFDSITGSIRFDTDKFSTYAIVYSDDNNKNNNNDDKNNNVINPDNNTPDSNISEPAVSDTNTADTDSSGVTTGDSANSLFYIIIMAAAFAVIGGTIVVSRKKAK